MELDKLSFRNSIPLNVGCLLRIRIVQFHSHQEIRSMTREEKHKRDEKYIEEISKLLPNFRKVREGVYRFFCIFCKGDINNSKHSKGYLYSIGDYYNYNCYRCNYRTSLRSLLKKLNPYLFLKREMEIEYEYVNQFSDNSLVEFHS